MPRRSSTRLTRKTAGLKVGDPKEMDTIIGPLINPAALEMVQRRVDAAVASGARVLTGGAASGPCYQPTLVSDVPAGSDLDRMETFGPVATVEVVDSDDDAVDRANATVVRALVRASSRAIPSAARRLPHGSRRASCT